MNSRENRKRKTALMVMLSEEEKEEIKDKSRTQGMTMSSYARWVLLKGIKKGRKQDG